MGRSKETFGKKEREKKRAKKKQDKARRKEERQSNPKGGDMIYYQDELGNFSETPPDPMKKKVVIDASAIEIGVPKRVKEEYDPIRKGRVQFFNDGKGFGFIKDDETFEEYFVHISGMIDDCREGDKVIFELERGQKGMNAVNVKKG